MDEEVVQQQINLLDKRFREEEALLSAKRIMSVWIGVVALLAAYSGYSFYGSIELEKKAENVLAEKKKIAQVLDNIDKVTPKGTIRSLEIEVERLKRERERKLLVKELLSGTELGNIKGFSGHLEGLAQQIIPNVWLTTINITDGGKNLGILGSTLDPKLVPRFIQRLSDEQSFGGSEFRTFLMETPEEEKKNEKDKLSKPATPHYVNFIVQTSVEKEDKVARVK